LISYFKWSRFPALSDIFQVKSAGWFSILHNKSPGRWVFTHFSTYRWERGWSCAINMPPRWGWFQNLSGVWCLKS